MIFICVCFSSFRNPPCPICGYIHEGPYYAHVQGRIPRQYCTYRRASYYASRAWGGTGRGMPKAIQSNMDPKTSFSSWKCESLRQRWQPWKNLRQPIQERH